MEPHAAVARLRPGSIFVRGQGHAHMIFNHFDARTRVHMEMALERVCRGRPEGQRHGFRRLLAERIIRAAAEGRTSVGQLAEAAERALIQMRSERKSA